MRRSDHQQDWRRKLAPIFFDLAPVNRDAEEVLARIERERVQRDSSSPASEEDRKRLDQEFLEWQQQAIEKIEARLIEINKRYGDIDYNRVAYNYLDASAAETSNDEQPFINCSTGCDITNPCPRRCNVKHRET